MYRRDHYNRDTRKIRGRRICAPDKREFPDWFIDSVACRTRWCIILRVSWRAFRLFHARVGFLGRKMGAARGCCVY